MNQFGKICNARIVLEIPEQTTIEEIRASYKSLIKKWHPDRCGKEHKETYTKKTTRIIEAYKIITTYCEQYKISFTQAGGDSNTSPEEWWFERFGNDPLWAKVKPDKT